MPVSAARRIAFEVLLKVETEDAYSSELLHSDRLATLSPQDRALAMEIVMGVLRWRSRLDEAIARFSFTPFGKLDLEVLTALRLAAYQLLYLDRVPARAAINESVELVKQARKASAAPLANAVLRKITAAALRSPTPSDDSDPAALARDFAHPRWLVERWAAAYGQAAAAAICAHDQRVPVATLRLRDASADAELRDSGVELAPGALLASARRVRSGDPTHTKPCLEHRIAIQDEASQLVAALVGRGNRILDCCAAPGGKTAAIADRNRRADIVAVELHPHRARLLRRLVDAPNVRVVAADARALPVSGLFDRILVDAPCSGTGTLARNPEIKWRLKPEHRAELRALQTAILRNALRHLAPGGRLIYSTCSLESEENEEVVALASEVVRVPHPTPVLRRVGKFVGREIAADVRLIDIRDELHRLQREGELIWADLESLARGPFLRTLPGIHPCDGFFAAVLERD